jgi:signal transduction histidine kinase
MKTEYHQRYLKEAGKKTLRTGRLAAMLAIVIIPFFYHLDINELKLENTLPWRMIGLIGAALFFIAFRFKNNPHLIIFLNAVTLTSCMVMMHGITFKVFTATDPVPAHEFGSAVGTMSVWMAITLFAAGSRWLLVASGLVLLIVNGLCYVFVQPPNVPGLAWSITMVGIFVLITMYLQEKEERKKAVVMYELEEREERIAQQRESLKRINENLVVYNFAMSHELKTPLRIASTYTQLLAREVEKLNLELNKDYIEKIRGSLKSGYQVIDDILLLSEIGNEAINPKKVNLDEIAMQIWEEQYELVRRERTIEFHKHSLGEIHADEKLMHHLFRNMLSNAIKYTGNKKEAVVELDASVSDDYKTILFKDNGIGFDNTYAKEIGKPFKRFHSTSNFKGTGVGLTIVKQIVNMHKGAFWAKGKVEEGATFFCKLPMQAPPDRRLVQIK